MIQKSVSEIIPYVEVGDGWALLGNGDIAYFLEVDHPEIFSMDEKDFDDLHDFFINSVKLLEGEEIIWQKNTSYIKTPMPLVPGDSFLGNAVNKRLESQFYIKETTILSIILTKNATLKNSYLKSPFNRSLKKVKKDQNRIENYLKSCDTLLDYFSTSKLIKAKIIDRETILDNAVNFFSLWEGLNSDIIYSPDLKIGNQYAQIFCINSLYNLPDQLTNYKKDTRRSKKGKEPFYMGLLQELGQSFKCNHLLTELIYFDPEGLIKKELENKRKNFKRFKAWDKENEDLLEDTVNVLQEASKSYGNSFCKHHVNLMIWADSKKELAALESKVISLFRGIGIKTYMPKGLNLNYVHLASLFGNGSLLPTLNSKLVYNTDFQRAFCLTHNVSSEKSDPKGIFFYEPLYNRPVLKDIRIGSETHVKAWNFAIVAPTGGGKSVLTQHILRQYREMGYKLIIIDLGESFYKWSLLFGLDVGYIKYEAGKPLPINPFNQKINSESIKNIADFILRMYDENKIPNKKERISAIKLIQAYFNTPKENPCFEDFYHFIETYKSDLIVELKIIKEYFDLDLFLHNTSVFVKDGVNQYLFNYQKEDELTYDKDIYIFELKNAINDPSILVVLLQMIYTLIDRIALNDKSSKSIVFFEEFAKMLKLPNVSTSVDYYAQTFRKENSALGIILQGMYQLPEESKLLTNIFIYYMLYNDTGDYSDLVNRLELSRYENYLLNSLEDRTKGKEKFTEFLMKIGTNTSIKRLFLSKEEFVTYQTDGDLYNLMIPRLENKEPLEAVVYDIIESQNI